MASEGSGMPHACGAEHGVVGVEIGDALADGL
jgi:hypothetical protein